MFDITMFAHIQEYHSSIYVNLILAFKHYLICMLLLFAIVFIIMRSLNGEHAVDTNVDTHATDVVDTQREQI